MYNVYVDLAIFGFLLCATGMTIIVMERNPKKGATPEPNRQQIIIHQQVRRIENERV